MVDLERELRTLGADLDVPEPPDVRGAVRARIASSRPTPLPTPTVRPRWVVAALAAILAVALVASPQARAALADVIRIAGIDVRWGDDADAPATPRSPLPGQRPTDLAAAREQVGFEIGVPTRLGEPDRVTVADAGRVVTLLYGPVADRIRIDEFDGRLESVFVKTLGIEAEQELVTGDTAWWLPAPHPLRYVDRDGVVRHETARLADSTLIWQSGAVSYRLEGDLTREEAVAIAESVR
jgi:hypothetical protein